MICARATVVAGQQHTQYTVGSSLPALVFADVRTDHELQLVAARELSARGWASVIIERCKDVTSPDRLQSRNTPEALALRDAIQSGFGVVFYPQGAGA